MDETQIKAQISADAQQAWRAAHDHDTLGHGYGTTIGELYMAGAFIDGYKQGALAQHRLATEAARQVGVLILDEISPAARTRILEIVKTLAGASA